MEFDGDNRDLFPGAISLKVGCFSSSPLTYSDTAALLIGVVDSPKSAAVTGEVLRV